MMLKGKIFKSLLIAALTCFSWQTSMGQKTFTLEDLNYGGTNFYNMRVQTRYTNWWGDELIKGDVEACYVVNKQTGKEQVLFELKDVNALLDSDKSHQVNHLMSCTFPYSNKTLAYIVTGKQHLLYDWAKKKIEWIQNKETEVVTLCMEKQCIETSLEYIKVCFGVTMESNWHSIVWTKVW